MATQLPPPDVPAIANLDPALTQYLRTLALWAMQRLNDKVPLHEATPFVLLSARDDPTKVFKLEVDALGAITATPMMIGGSR